MDAVDTGWIIAAVVSVFVSYHFTGRVDSYLQSFDVYLSKVVKRLFKERSGNFPQDAKQFIKR